MIAKEFMKKKVGKMKLMITTIKIASKGALRLWREAD